MKFPIGRKVTLPKQPNKINGLGDVVAVVAEPIKKTLEKIPNKTLQDYLANCNCQARKDYLNKHFPLRKT